MSSRRRLTGPLTDGDQHRPLGAGAERVEVVAAGHDLHDQPGVLGEAAQLVGTDEADAVRRSQRTAGSPWPPSS